MVSESVVEVGNALTPPLSQPRYISKEAMYRGQGERGKAELAELPLEDLYPSPFNPRKNFPLGPLQELADSIREQGLGQPIVVRPRRPGPPGGHGGPPLQSLPLPEGGGESLPKYEIVAGERRYRACILAGLQSAPCLVRRDLEDDDAAALKLALTENLQREGLDVIEEAEGFRDLKERCGLREREIAETIGKSQPVVANRLRLLGLPAPVQGLIRAGQLSPAHGISLARFKDYPPVVARMAQLAVDSGLSTRHLEDKLPCAWSLVNEKLIRHVPGIEPWTRRCPQCPAYRAPDEYHSYCLDPACFDSIKAELERERQEAIRRREEAIREKLAAAAAEAGADPAAPSLTYIPNLRSDSYELLITPPAGCAADCAKRVRGLDQIAQEREICRDPACFKRLRLAEEEAKKKAQAAHYQSLLAALAARIDALDSLGSREWALLALAALYYDNCKKTLARSVFKRHGLEALFAEKSDPTSYDFRRTRFAELAALPAEALARAAVHVILANDLYQRHGQRYGRADSRWHDWYMGPEVAAAADNQTESVSETESG